MPAVGIDTSVLLAFADTQDPDHEAGHQIVTRIDSGAFPTAHATDYVVLETLNWIHSRKRHDTAVEFYNDLETSAGFDIVKSAQRDYTRAVELFRRHEEPAFGDCTIAAYVERANLDFVYTFDPEDFEVFEWVQPLTTPVNPFDPE